VRIGLFTDAYLPEITGVTILVRRLRDELERLGHEAFVYAPRYAEPCDDERNTYRFRSGPVFAYKTARMALPYNRGASRTFSSLDVIHSHTPFSLAYVALAAAYRHRIPHVQTYHTYLSQYRHYVPRPIRPSVKAAESYSAMLCNRCTVVTVPTQSIEQELRRFGVRRPIHVLPFGPDLRLYDRPAAWNPREALGVPEAASVFLYAGRLAEEKNLRFLMDAFARIHADDERSVLVIAGDGPLRGPLESEAAKRGLEAAVRFAGFLDQPRLTDLYKAADLFLFASKTETQGLVLVEAMAGGTPAIAVHAQGVKDVVESGVNGFLVPEEPDAFAEKALAVIRSPELMCELRTGARRSAEESSVQTSTRRVVEIYEACGEHRRRSRIRLRRRLVRGARLRLRRRSR
jgi:1,2-diacylglycerol 3-alpha-glucosyltransferase